MRDIRFRIYDSWNKVMRQVSKLELDLDEEYISALVYENTEFKFRYSSLYSPIMQYTGLKDKNGKEIYEGDICDFETPGDRDHSGHSHWYKNSVIEYKDNSFQLKYLCGKYHVSQEKFYGYVDDWTRDLHLCIVIGNIYENPELLEESKNEQTD